MVGTPPPLCNSPTLEINGTRGSPHPAASQADAYLFQVKISGLLIFKGLLRKTTLLVVLVRALKELSRCHIHCVIIFR